MTNLPKIVGDTWFNSDPLKPEDLKGKVVLADFWTYSCVNCKRTLPYLRAWWDKYKDKDFVLIGIHTPEFKFEKDPKNVSDAIKDLGVTWPVVLDNEHTNWNNFANRFWPAKYLANKEGKIVYDHFGEGGYGKTEREIQKTLGIEKGKIEITDESKDEHAHGSVCFIPTPEVYSGWERGNLANIERYKRDEVFSYARPKNINDGQINLEGSFLAKREYVESKGVGVKLSLRFHATEVNLVLHAADKIAVIDVKFSGQLPTGDIYGHDVKNGQVMVVKPRMYNLLRSNGLMDGTLELTAKEGDFQAYAFTFSGCEH